MKKILTLMIGALLLSTLTACTGLGYGDITKKNTLWKSEDGRLSFEIQGIKDYEGIGTIVINDEEINVEGFCKCCRSSPLHIPASRYLSRYRNINVYDI